MAHKRNIDALKRTIGDLIKSEDWNAIIDELARLEDEKLSLEGGDLGGPLKISGANASKPWLEIHGTENPTLRITSDGNDEISGRLSLRQRNNSGADLYYDGRSPSGGFPSEKEFFALETFSGGKSEGVKLCVKLDGMVGIGTEDPRARLHVGGYLRVDKDIIAERDLRVGEDVIFRKGERSAQLGDPRLSRQDVSNERDFKQPNLKLNMGRLTLPREDATPWVFEFAIGYDMHISPDYANLKKPTRFRKVFSVNQNGDVSASGQIGCYLVDHFINRVGDTVEQGDVVIIEQPATRFSGTGDNIPIPEIGLTDRAGDTRVCGIVAKAVTRADLPYAEPKIAKSSESAKETGTKASKAGKIRHPLQSYTARLKDAEGNKVGSGHMGTMVTSGSFAHCKVDADIASIEVGDLLMTSPTPGHAQKVDDKSRAVGAIIGKALATKKKGQGKIPVMVMLQ